MDRDPKACGPWTPQGSSVVFKKGSQDMCFRLLSSHLCPPPGLYGHSAVYHEATDSLYVFGGFRFHVELAAPSPELYSLHCPDRTWSLLAPSQGAKVRKRSQQVDVGTGGRCPASRAPWAGCTQDFGFLSFLMPCTDCDILILPYLHLIFGAKTLRARRRRAGM